jgi:hypothetical protein
MIVFNNSLSLLYLFLLPSPPLLINHQVVLRKTRYLQIPERDRISVMGYSLRTPEWKLITFLHYNMTSGKVNTAWPAFWSELYDHRNETLQDFTHLETVNIAKEMPNVVEELRRKLVDYLTTSVVFRGDSPRKNTNSQGLLKGKGKGKRKGGGGKSQKADVLVDY